MQEIKQIILEHHKRYPQMLLEDIVKLVYQNEFGNGHFITDEEASLVRLEREFSQVAVKPGELFETIGNGFVRLHLGALENRVALQTVNSFFVATATQSEGSVPQFEEKLGVLTRLCEEGLLPYDPKELDDYLERYQAAGYPPVSHSHRYRDRYAPSYRVLSSLYALYFPVFQEIESLLRKKESILVAIDGPSGSGKSTLGQILKTVYACPVVSMDHFFLPPEKRTPGRLNEPGGNVDYERFQAEVVPHLKRREPFSYQVYDCQQDSMKRSPSVEPHSIAVVEGSYSHHPALAESYDLKVFLSISPVEQRERILKRNGPVMLERFLTEWIPLENRYFADLKIREHSDLVLSPNKW